MTRPTHFIDALFPEVRLAQFLFDVYPDQRCCHHGDLKRLAAYIDTEALAALDPTELLALLPADSRVIVYEQTERDRPAQRVVPAAEAATQFRAGNAVSIEYGLDAVPGLQQASEQLAAELGLDEPLPPAVVFSPAGSVVPAHFDGLELLIVQLVGTKSWFLADNDEVVYPDFPYFPGERGAGPRGGRAARSQPTPPTGFEHVKMTPGTAVFVPRGVWHSTRADEPCFNAVFRLATPLAATLVGRAVERALRQQSRWRKPIAGAAGPLPLQRLAAQNLRPLLTTLLDDLGRCDLDTTHAVLDREGDNA